MEVAEFDRPLFKRLAHNDTGGASGHQGGFVVPKSMEHYFPLLSLSATPATPTIDVEIRAALFLESTEVGIVRTRYQFQTWGGSRSPERRITGNLGPLRNVAHQDDFLIIERGIDDTYFFRLTLVRRGTPAFGPLVEAAGSRRWGPLDGKDAPVWEIAIRQASIDQDTREHSPLALFDNSAALVETRTVRMARSRAFKARVTGLYDYRCAICGEAHRSATGLSEAEAAHIVPRGLKGADDARNGLALCRSHHWAFDRGLFGIRPTGIIVVPPATLAHVRNHHLAAFNGAALRPPGDPALAPAAAALDWHLTRIVGL